VESRPGQEKLITLKQLSWSLQ